MLEYVQDLVAEMPGVCGVKDSSRHMIYFHRLIEVAKQRADWSVLVGPEELTAEAVLLGDHGGINGGANLHPKLYVQMYQAAVAQDLKRTRELHAQVMQLAGSIYTVGKHKSAIIKGLKCALSLMGICEDHLPEPFHRFRDAEREIICERLIALGLL
jgi:dihydrodipicolinate synthase/N-acetylneuraminate lyase